MLTFLVIWIGQVISTFGSNLTGFALGVLVYQQTGSTTRFALIALATTLPGILLSPMIGALVDRWDRRWAMIVGDTGAGCSTLALALLLWFDRLELWHIYLILAVSSTFGALQWPAFSAATTLIVPKRHLGRASGLTSLGSASAELLAPLAAGILVGTIGLRGVVSIDVATFLIAVLTLLAIRIPKPKITMEGPRRSSLLQEAHSGWLFIQTRPGLLALLGLFAAIHLSLGMVQVLLTPMVLSFTSPAVLGRVLTAAGTGMLAGSLLMSVWGGPQRRIAGILGALAVQGAVLMIAGLRPNAVLIAVAGFAFFLALPIVNGCSQAIWQSKVDPALQGRVFAVRRMIAWSTLPLAYVVAGPLADHVFEPLMAADGPLSHSLGLVLGVGKGRGIALLFMILGLIVLLTAVSGFRFRRLSQLESELPDTIPEEAP